MATVQFTEEQNYALAVIVRTMAALSAAATILLLLTFWRFKEFRTLPNTLIFLSSPANILANIGHFIAEDGLANPDGALCQAQAFLLQCFVQADPYWSCAASITVGLIFFFRFESERIKKLYWIYAIACYGIPFAFALLGLFYKNSDKPNGFYGDAMLWCWIDGNHPMARIYSFYGPVWVTILISISLYVTVGVHVYKTRSQLHCAMESPHHGTSNGTTTCVIQTPRLAGMAQTDGEDGTALITHPKPSYSIPLPLQSASASPTFLVEAQPRAHANDSAHQPRGYFTRIHLIIAQTQAFFSVIGGVIRESLDDWKVDDIKYKYTKSALLFTASILITWIPPSINRVYSAIYTNRQWSYPLSVASALVLPSQGLWNTLIFFSTSVPTCKRVWRKIKEGQRLGVAGKFFGWKPAAVNLPLSGRGL